MGKHPLYNQTGLQRDNKSHVLYALANKQMELKQVEKEYQSKILKIRNDLIALETTLCLFDDSYSKNIDISKEKRLNSKKDDYFKRGELKTSVLKVLRTKTVSLKAREVAKEIQILKDIPTSNSEINSHIAKIVNDSLRHIEKQGLVAKDEDVKDSIIHWKIKD